MKIRIGFLGFAVIQSCVTLAEEQKDWVINLDAGLVSDSNINNGLEGSREVSDQAFYLSASGDYYYDLSNKSLLTAKATIESEQYDKLSDLSWLALGGEVSIGWQPEFGFLAPFYRASVSVKQIETDDHAREARKIKAQLVATKRITSQVTGRVGLNWLDTTADEETYSVNQSQIFANLDYYWNQDLTVYGIVSFTQGDLVSIAETHGCHDDPMGKYINSYARVTNMSLDGVGSHHEEDEHKEVYFLDDVADRKVDDHVFSEAFCGDWKAFRLDAETVSFSLGGNYLLNSNLSLDVSYSNADSEVDSEFEYQKEIFRAGILYQF